MAIVAQDSSTYARLRFNTGPGGETKIPVCVEYGYQFDATDFELWKQQYLANVVEDDTFTLTRKSRRHAGREEEIEVFGSDGSEDLSVFDGQDILSEIDSVDPMEREYFMEELSIRSEFWDEDESEVIYE